MGIEIDRTHFEIGDYRDFQRRLEENLAAASLRLPEDVMATLDDTFPPGIAAGESSSENAKTIVLPADIPAAVRGIIGGVK